MAAQLFIIVFILWLGILTVFHILLIPQPLQPAESQPDAEVTPRVIPQAETLEYFHLEKRLVATGQVVIISGETRLFADHVELNTESGVGQRSGKSDCSHQTTMYKPHGSILNSPQVAVCSTRAPE